jgi:transposase-like protein
MSMDEARRLTTGCGLRVSIEIRVTITNTLLQKGRDKAAAKRFFKRVLASCAEAPRKIVPHQLRSHPVAKAERFPHRLTSSALSSSQCAGQ